MKRSTTKTKQKREQCRVVMVSCGKLSEARRIARAAVPKRLAACVNVVLAPVESVYRWKGNVEVAREYLLVMKTMARRVPDLQLLVQRLHSYDVPEFIALKIVDGSREYLKWLEENVNSPTSA